MKTYRVYAVVTGSKYLGTVEAKDEDDAKEKAFDLDSCHVSLCHQCDNECEEAMVSEVSVEEGGE